MTEQIRAVFLRGVNVNGITVRSADLRRVLGGVPGIERATTVLATGNALVASGLPGPALKAAVESALREAFAYDAWVVVLDRDDVAAILAACPYALDDAGTHAYVTLASDVAALDDVVAARGADVVRLHPLALAWTAPVGGSLDAPTAKLLAKARFKATTTTRNARTLAKVLAARL